MDTFITYNYFLIIYLKGKKTTTILSIVILLEINKIYELIFTYKFFYEINCTIIDIIGFFSFCFFAFMLF